MADPTGTTLWVSTRMGPRKATALWVGRGIAVTQHEDYGPAITHINTGAQILKSATEGFPLQRVLAIAKVIDARMDLAAMNYQQIMGSMVDCIEGAKGALIDAGLFRVTDSGLEPVEPS